MWSPECEQTLQWHRAGNGVKGESAWQTVVRRFPRLGWEVVAPQQVIPGPSPELWPAALPAMPHIVDDDDDRVDAGEAIYGHGNLCCGRRSSR